MQKAHVLRHPTTNHGKKDRTWVDDGEHGEHHKCLMTFTQITLELFCLDLREQLIVEIVLGKQIHRAVRVD